MPLQVEVVRAWPRRSERTVLMLPDGSTVADALSASGWSLEGIAAYAIHGECVPAHAQLQHGDRLELLRPLKVDPKEARRKRARGR